MKRIALIALLSFSALQAEELTQDEVTVKIEKGTDSIKGFKAFNVSAQSSAVGPKSAEIRIYLGDNTKKEVKGARGECTVFIKLQPNGSEEQEKQCKEKSPSNSFSAEIIKVFNFIP